MRPNLRSLFFILSCLILLPASLFAAFNGTYTIDPSKAASAGNYLKIGSAISDLVSGTRTDGGKANGKGVSGPVVFKIADGVYKEQLSIAAISGTSSVNTVTFTSASNDSTKVILTFLTSPVSSSSNNYTLQINGGDYCIFKHITIARTFQSTNPYYYGVIDIEGGSDSNKFVGNIIRSLYVYQGSSSGGIINTNLNSASHGNLFQNNIIKNGPYAFCYLGTAKDYGLTIKSNLIDSIDIVAINLNYENNCNILNNKIRSFGDGIRMSNVVALNISNNDLSDFHISYGIYLNYCTAYKGYNIIANNIISANNGFSNIANSDSILMVYNSMQGLTNIQANNAVIFYSSSNVILQNNNIMAGSWTPFSISNKPIVSDHNNIYTTNTKFGTWLGTSASNSSKWTATSKQDSHSTTAKVLFVNSSLFCYNPNLDGKAKPNKLVTTDINGKARDTIRPYVGAYEIKLFANDASLFPIARPLTDSICIGSNQKIKVYLYNTGSKQLTSADINWQVNGRAKPVYKWKGALNAGDSILVTVDTLNITTYKQNIRIKASNPNGITDSNTTYDSVIYIGSYKMGGSYTIGGGKADFKTFNDAVKTLIDHDICGPVTFYVKNGVYNEQVQIANIPNISSVNNVTFQSLSHDSSKVILSSATSNNPNTDYTLLLDAPYFTFNQITITRQGGDSFSNVIALTNNSGYDRFLNCRILGRYMHKRIDYINPPSFNMSSSLVSCLSPPYSAYSCEFRNNVMKYGEYAFSILGCKNIIYYNNLIDSCVNGGMRFEAQTNAIIQYNTITHPLYKGYIGIYITSGDSSNISNNRILLYPYANQGIYAKCYLHAYNNIIALGAYGQGEGCTGIYDYLNAANIYYNNIRIDGADTTSIIMNIYTSNKVINLFNNRLENMAGGLVMKTSYVYTGLTSNYNNMISSGFVKSLYFINQLTDLAGWQKSSTLDKNSIDIDGWSVTDTNTFNPLLNAAANPLPGFPLDIDGRKRNTKTPDIGVYEFTPANNDIGLIAIRTAMQTCSGDSLPLAIKIKNYGVNKISSATIGWKINGISQTAKNWTGSLNPGDSTILTLGKVVFTSATPLSAISAFSYNPNGLADGNTFNDSIGFKVYVKISGTFTIGGSSPDFKTINAAVARLISNGICGNVKFSIRNGKYEEQIYMPKITGMDKNSISFYSESGDSTKVIISYPSFADPAPLNYVIWMDSVSNISFKNLTFQRSGNYQYANVAILKNVGNNVSFTGNLFKGIQYIANRKLSGSYLFNLTGKASTGFIFKYNSLRVGEQGIVVNGLLNPLISHNSVDSTGIGIFYIVDSGYIEKNRFTNIAFTGAYGAGGHQLRIQKNYISVKKPYYLTPLNGSYPLVGFNVNINAPRPYGLVFANNVLIVDGVDAIKGYSSANIAIVYNSVLVKGLNSKTSAITTDAYANYPILNNQFINFADGMALYLPNTSTTSYQADYCNYYNSGYWYLCLILSGGGSGVGYVGLNGASMKQVSWAGKFGFNDLHSPARPPFYKSNDDLHTKQPYLDGAGTVFSMITDDMDGNPRDKSTPDIGAYEYSITDNDLAIYNLDYGLENTCADTSPKLNIQIYNGGAKAQSNFLVQAEISSNNKTIKIIDTVKTTINPASVINYTFLETLSTYTTADYKIKVYTNLPNDGDRKDDTMIYVGHHLKTITQPVDTQYVCYGKTASIAPKKMGAEKFIWYADSTTTKVLSKSDTLLISTTKDTTLYIASDGTQLYKIGDDMQANIETTPTPITSATDHLPIKAFQNLTLDSISIYPKNKISFVLILKWPTGKVSKRRYNLTNPNPGKMMTIPVGFAMPASGQYYTLSTDSMNGDGLYGVPFEAPQSIRNILDIPSLYYSMPKFTKLQFVFKGCGTGNRVPVSIRPLKNINPQLVPDSAFSGQFLSGTKLNPDKVCAGGTVGYQLKTALKNADYGKAWTIKSATLSTVNSTAINNLNYTIPSLNKPATFSFRKDTTLIDTVLRLTIKVGILNSSCDTTIVRYVNVPPFYKANFHFKNPCANDTAIFTDEHTDSTGLSYKWYFGDGAVSGKHNPTHHYAKAGIYIVSFVSSNTAGCSDSISQKITILPIPSLNFIMPTEVCQGSQAQFTDSSQGVISGSRYHWNFGDGDTSIMVNPQHVYKKAGSYIVSLHIASSNSCSATLAKTIVVLPRPVVGFVIPSKACTGDLVALTDTTQNTSGKTAAYAWNFGDGNNAGIQNPTHTYNNTGTYLVKLKVTFYGGCTDSASNKIIIRQNATAAFTSASKVCPGQTIQFKDSSSIGKGDTVTYKWIFGDGDSSSLPSPTHAYKLPGSYTVNLSLKNKTGCTSQMSKTVNVIKPVASFKTKINNMTVRCIPDDSTLASYKWDFGDGNNSTAIKPSHTYSKDSTYLIKLKTQNSMGCVGTDSASVTVPGISNIAMSQVEGFDLNVYPNPSNGVVFVSFDIIQATYVSLTLYSMDGRQTTILASKLYNIGKQTISIDPIKDNLNPGVYLLKLQTNDLEITKRIVLER